MLGLLLSFVERRIPYVAALKKPTGPPKQNAQC
jgi:hypothetical protein